MPKGNQPATSPWPRWANYILIGLVGLSIGFGVRVFAQTFADPTCDPSVNPGGCNTSSPLFLAPLDKTTAQVVQTPVTFGTPTANKDVTLQGNLLLGTATSPGTSYTIQRTALAGQAINVSSTDSYAIVAHSLDPTKAAIAAFGDGTGTIGLLAQSSTGYAIDAVGNVRISGSLTVGGQPVGGASGAYFEVNMDTATKDITLPGATLGGVTFPQITSPFTITSMEVLYDADTSTKITWRQVVGQNLDGTTYAEYKECNNSAFYGHLILAAPVGTKMRVNLGYTTNAPQCGGAIFTVKVDSTSVDLNSLLPAGCVNNATCNRFSIGNGFRSYFRFTADDPSLPSYVGASAKFQWDFDGNGSVDCEFTGTNATAAAADCPGTVPAGGFTYDTVNGSVLDPIVKYPTSVTMGTKNVSLQITDDFGPSDKGTVQVNVFKASLVAKQRPVVTQYVNALDSTPYASITLNVTAGNTSTYVSCRGDLNRNNTNYYASDWAQWSFDILANPSTNRIYTCANTTNTVLHTAGTPVLETTILFHNTCNGRVIGASGEKECAGSEATYPVTTVSPSCSGAADQDYTCNGGGYNSCCSSGCVINPAGCAQPTDWSTTTRCYDSTACSCQCS
jgi:hypothetical protein